MRKLSFLVLFLGLFMTIRAQQLLTENFNYTAGTALTANGWTLNGFPNTNPINVTSTGLSYSGYILSGVGNAAYLNNNGSDVYQAGLTTVNTGAVYTSFMYKLDTAKTGDYCFGYLSSINPNTYIGKVYFKAASAGYYKIGLAKNTDAAVYSTDSFAVGTTAMVVVKYKFATGSATNDTVTLYHFTSGFPATEPVTYTLRAVGVGSQDATNIARAGIRQGVVTQAPSLTIDGIRMAQKWSDLNDVTSNKPAPLTFIFVNNITATTARINFNKATTYNRNLHNVVLFLKKGDTIAAGTPVKSTHYYYPDSNFAGSGTPFEYDTAVCVYNGDSNLVNIVGLTPSTRYRVIGYSATEIDSAYSDALLSAVFTTTTTAPGNFFGVTFTATSKNSANITWIKNPNYNNANHTTMVYIKELSAITTGLNNMNPLNIIADTNFNGIGTRYVYDNAARCVYNGDLTTVSVGGLKPGTRYYVMVLGASVADSNYAAASTANGITPTGGPNVPTTVRFTGKNENNSTISWVKPAGYVDSTHTILVFMRKDTFNYIFPAASIDVSNYTADSNYLGGGTPFEGDTASTCVYKGDGTITGVTNLEVNTRYYVLIYAVKTDSNLYSLPTIINNRTMVDSVVNLKFAGSSSTSALISWTNPANYTPGTHQTLVFVKEGSPINVGTPTRPINRYTANANFGSGTKYQNDTGAYCVYRATFNSVTVNNLKFGKTYYAIVMVIRATDSVYSRVNSTSGGTLDQPPVHDIGPLVRTITTNGVIDSNNVRATLRGVVYGGNNRTNGVQFVIRDHTGGITVYHTTKNFGYTPVTEGDSVEVVGTASQLNGLAIITTLDTIRLISTGITVNSPREVSTLNETTENDLVQFSRVTLLSAITNWPTNGNVNLKNSYTGDTIVVRIYSTSSLAGKTAPVGEFSIAGMGSQATTSNVAPFPFNNYRIVPRGVFDISMNTGDTLSNFPLLVPTTPVSTVLLDGDTNQVFTVTCGTAHALRGVGDVTYVLLFDESVGDFSLPMFGKAANNSGLDTVASTTYGELIRTIPNLLPGDSVILRVTMMANFNALSKLADQKRLVIFKMPPAPTGLNQLLSDADFRVFPNPASDKLIIKTHREVSTASLMDLSGKLVISENFNGEINVAGLSNGMYILSLQTENGVWYHKIQVNH